MRLRKLRLQIAVNALTVQQTLVSNAEAQKQKTYNDMLHLAAELNARDEENRRNLTGNTVSQATLERYRQDILAIDQQLAESADSHAQAREHLEQMRSDLTKKSADYLAKKKSLEQLETAFQEENNAAALLQAEIEDEDRDEFHSPTLNAGRA
ncbi:hypothetical protein HB779_21095 (plasmid) [Phyllobacterium sp. 628]|uniref:hypothetical protein n=1 Tax=Phyllobacterium sp. 628 TaxID=2718938 RepID=UPI0016623B1F|nr:hypothetical protein [Phyllobacterium sp. 628]QND54420.1 hypothetical protein HB779_21095 [Phyllobacterium sp. 628]